MSHLAEKMQTVLLSGSLARKFGRRHRFTTGAGFNDIRGYFKQFPGFEQHMMESSSKGLRNAIFNGKENIGEDDIENASEIFYPFVVENNTAFPKAAFIEDGSITNAKIGNVIQSDDFVAGQQGWRISKSLGWEMNGSVPGSGRLSMNSTPLQTAVQVFDPAGTRRVRLGVWQ